MAMSTLTERFIDALMAIDFDTLPPAAIDVAKHVTLDGLAVMLAGATEPLGVGRISIEYVRLMGGTPQANVIAGGFKTSITNAAYERHDGSRARLRQYVVPAQPPDFSDVARDTGDCGRSGIRADR